MNNKQKRKDTRRERRADRELLRNLGRNDHEVVNFRGRMIPVLGTVGGTKEESEQTAKNIERYFAGKNGGGQ